MGADNINPLNWDVFNPDPVKPKTNNGVAPGWVPAHGTPEWNAANPDKLEFNSAPRVGQPNKRGGVGAGTFGAPETAGAPTPNDGTGGKKGGGGFWGLGGITDSLKGNSLFPKAPGAAAPAAAAPTKGTESGPGILENWFNQRAGGTDPGWEYSTGRASAEINNRAARSGGYGSSGAQQSINDMFANAITQRQGQLDSLAGGASGEHAGRLGSMFNVGNDLAKNQADTAYGKEDTALAQKQYDSAMEQIQLRLSRGEIDQATANQQMMALQKSLGDVATTAGKLQGDKQGQPATGTQVVNLDTSGDNIPSRYDT